MNRIPLPPLWVLHERFTYDTDTGEIRYRKTGKIAGYVSCRGYIHLDVKGVKYAAHRVAYKMMTGEEPEVLDHIDRNKSNNAWVNIRKSTHIENARNRPLQSNNKSGHSGIYLEPNGRYRACIFIRRKCINLGRFPSLQEAIDVRQRAEKQYGFHESHGR